MAEAKIRELFDKFDADKSGQISAKELVDFLRQAEPEKNPGLSDEEYDTIAKEKASHVLTGGDKNDDDKISFQELFNLLKNYVKA